MAMVRLTHSSLRLTRFSRFSFSDPTRPMTEAINHVSNQIFSINVVHIISQMSDILCNACGGHLPLLASATSASVNIITFDLSQCRSIRIVSA